MGPRVPSAAGSPRVHRQAFIYLVTAGKALENLETVLERTSATSIARPTTNGFMESISAG